MTAEVDAVVGSRAREKVRNNAWRDENKNANANDRATTTTSTTVTPPPPPCCGQTLLAEDEDDGLWDCFYWQGWCFAYWMSFTFSALWQTNDILCTITTLSAVSSGRPSHFLPEVVVADYAISSTWYYPRRKTRFGTSVACNISHRIGPPPKWAKNPFYDCSKKPRVPLKSMRIYWIASRPFNK